jgi:hypothetical protein
MPVGGLGVPRYAISLRSEEPLIETCAAHGDGFHFDGAGARGVWDLLIEGEDEDVCRATDDAFGGRGSSYAPTPAACEYVDLLLKEFVALGGEFMQNTSCGHMMERGIWIVQISEMPIDFFQRGELFAGVDLPAAVAPDRRSPHFQVAAIIELVVNAPRPVKCHHRVAWAISDFIYGWHGLIIPADEKVCTRFGVSMAFFYFGRT